MGINIKFKEFLLLLSLMTGLTFFVYASISSFMYPLGKMSSELITYKQAVINCYDENNSFKNCSSNKSDSLKKFHHKDYGIFLEVKYGVINVKLDNKKFNAEADIFFNKNSISPSWEVKIIKNEIGDVFVKKLCGDNYSINCRIYENDEILKV